MSLQKKEATLAPVVSKVGKAELLDSVQPIANFERIPPLIAIAGQICYYCHLPDKTETYGKTKHATCNRCKAVKYCNATCQKKDWSRHKGVCKVIGKFESSKLLKQLLVLQLMDAPFEEQEQLDAAITKLVHIQVDIGKQLLKRPLNVQEHNLISLCPRCTLCGKSEAMLRIEAEMYKVPVKTLRECRVCGLAWACSEEHWQAVKHRHRFDVAIGGRDNLPECMLNAQIMSDINVMIRLVQTGRGDQPNVWVSGRPRLSYKSIKGSDWENEIGSEVHNQHQLVRNTLKRLYTVALSMPFSIMWALEGLNGDNTGWTLKQNMTIHVLGSYQYENAHSKVFEELLHRLPRLKKLKVYFIGPQMEELAAWGANGKETNEELCSLCTKGQKKMFHASWGKTYHDLIKSEGKKLPTPDFAVAYNAALAYDKDRENLWGPTIKYLVDNNIPSLFTSYCKEDAQSDVDVLQEAGARIPEGLGPLENEWMSLQYKKEPRKSGSYYSINNWITGAFKGREGK